MKKVLTAALLAVLTGGVALAQSAPPSPPAGTMQPPPPAQMQQMRDQLMRLHRQARASILAALTPAHKALFARITGQLAVADRPDCDAAVKQLNAALSAPEKQKIMAAAQTAMAKMRAMMPPGDMGPPPGMGMGMDGMPGDHAMATMTAGDILLLLARLSITPQHQS